MPTLIQRILKGDKQAITEFYERFSPKIFVYLKKRLPREEDAQEIMQDVFFDVLDSLPILKNYDRVLPLLYKIAHNKQVDFYRKRKIKSLLFSQLPLLQIISQEMHNPEFIYEKNKIRDQIEYTFSVLSKRHREILKMHYIEDRQVKDIAISLNLSFKATESLLFRARKGFQKAYERA